GQFDYRIRPAPGWSARADLQRASDENYFIDLGSNLNDSAIQFLRSSVSLRGTGRYWALDLLADTFQVLDESVGPGREPYRRLPRALLDVDRPMPGNLRFSLDAEAVYFDRDVGVTGTRVDLFPRLHYDLVRPGWHVRPAVGLRSPAYPLHHGMRSSLHRTLPVTAVDAGLPFKPTPGSGRAQTLQRRRDSHTGQSRD